MKKFFSTYRFPLLFTVMLLAYSGAASAQCAMCKAVAEDSINENGYGIAAGLNNGILFLMGIPYILLATLFFVFFRKQIAGFWKSFSEIHG